MKTIAVLMTCYNRVETTLRCLRSLFSQAMPDGYEIEVWLVDDASPDKTGERVTKVFPQVNVIQSPGNLFWCKGMRLAWDKAAEAKDYDAYLWLNDDVELYSGAVRMVVQDYLEVAGEWAESVVYGSFAAERGSQKVSYGCVVKRGDSSPFHPDGVPHEVQGETTGNFVFVSRAAFLAAGKICGKFRHGVADTDYGLVLAEKGCRKYVASGIVGWCRPNLAASCAQLREMSLRQRVALLWAPKGRNLHDNFLLRYRHWGLCRAILSSVHVILMVVFARSPSGR